MIVFEIEIMVEGGSFLGMNIDISEVAPIVLILGNRGFVMYCYLNLEVVERMSVAAAMVSRSIALRMPDCPNARAAGESGGA